MNLDLEFFKVMLTVSFFILSVFALLVTIKYAKKSKWIYMFIPFILALSVATGPAMERVMGYPIQVEDKSEQLYVAHMVGKEQKWIYIWAIDESISNVPRAYKIPYTKEDEEKIEKAKEKKEKGIPQGLVLPDEEQETGNDDDSLKLYDFNRMKGIQK